MEEKIAVLVDSGSDLPEALKEEYHITTMELRVIYGNEIYRDGIDITPQTVYSRFPKEIPTTSAPNLQEAKDTLKALQEKGYQKVIAVCISSGLSSTYHTIHTAAKEYPELETFVFDSKNISIGAGLYALWAAKAVKDGMSFQQITAALQRKQRDSKIYFYMDSLDYLRAGGRIGQITGLIGKVLNIRPIISCNTEGTYYTVSMVRGKKGGARRLLDTVGKCASKAKTWLALMNGGAAEQAHALKTELMSFFPKGQLMVESQITASMAVHTGPGLVGICVFQAD
ncbi:MAG: DegV family protein [Oscillospiraceae bacterium]|nr:DegV family protein [Oscillospiraceae bacterium]